MSRTAPAQARATPPRRTPGRAHRLTATAVACLALGMAIALSLQYARTYSLARQAERLDTRRAELKAENQALREEIHRLQTDDRYIEQLAREQLGLLKPGEVELQIVPPPSGMSAGGPSFTPEEAPQASAEEAKGLAGPSWLARLWALAQSVLTRLRR